MERELIYHEITNKSPKIPIISHLALGEAYGNCLIKGEEEASDFLDFIKLLKKNKFLNIIGNDNIDKIFDDLRSNKEIRLSITDAIHMATAIKNKCCIFKTADVKDFARDKKKILEISRDYGIELNVSILKL